jgi:hypothetical protein
LSSFRGKSTGPPPLNLTSYSTALVGSNNTFQSGSIGYLPDYCNVTLSWQNTSSGALSNTVSLPQLSGLAPNAGPSGAGPPYYYAQYTFNSASSTAAGYQLSATCIYTYYGTSTTRTYTETTAPTTSWTIAFPPNYT